MLFSWFVFAHGAVLCIKAKFKCMRADTECYELRICSLHFAPTHNVTTQLKEVLSDSVVLSLWLSAENPHQR